MVSLCCSPEAQRIGLWMAWAIQLLITTIFFILAMVMFSAIFNCTPELQVAVIHDAAWRGPLASLLLGGIVVFLFNLISCWILIRKSINRSGPGFGYGFIMSYSFTVAFLALLVALVLDGFQDVVDNQLEALTGSCWTSYDSSVYTATKAFAVLCFIIFMLFFAILIILQGAVKEHLGISQSKASNPYSRLGPDVTILPPGQLSSAPVERLPSKTQKRSSTPGQDAEHDIQPAAAVERDTEAAAV